jgi:hypothetical protein
MAGGGNGVGGGGGSPLYGGGAGHYDGGAGDRSSKVASVYGGDTLYSIPFDDDAEVDSSSALQVQHCSHSGNSNRPQTVWANDAADNTTYVTVTLSMEAVLVLEVCWRSTLSAPLPRTRLPRGVLEEHVCCLSRHVSICHYNASRVSGYRSYSVADIGTLHARLTTSQIPRVNTCSRKSPAYALRCAFGSFWDGGKVPFPL